MVMTKESAHETESNMREEDNVKSLPSALTHFFYSCSVVLSCKQQAELTIAKLERGNHWTS